MGANVCSFLNIICSEVGFFSENVSETAKFSLLESWLQFNDLPTRSVDWKIAPKLNYFHPTPVQLKDLSFLVAVC